MKKVTISLDEGVLARLRAEAAVQGKGVSKFISDLLEREIGGGGKGQVEAIEEFLAGALWSLSNENGRLPAREGIYAGRADELLRRYERSHSRDR